MREVFSLSTSELAQRNVEENCKIPSATALLVHSQRKPMPVWNMVPSGRDPMSAGDVATSRKPSPVWVDKSARKVQIWRSFIRPGCVNRLNFEEVSQGWLRRNHLQEQAAVGNPPHVVVH